jgi:hypothetical protein
LSGLFTFPLKPIQDEGRLKPYRPHIEKLCRPRTGV